VTGSVIAAPQIRMTAAPFAMQHAEQNLDSNGNINVDVQGVVAARSADEEIPVSKRVDSPICTDTDFYTVPAGKDLVIEYIAATAQTSDPDVTVENAHAWIGSGTDIRAGLPVIFSANPGGPAAPQANADLTASQAVHFMVPAGTTLFFHGEGTYSGALVGCPFAVGLGGYLTPA